MEHILQKALLNFLRPSIAVASECGNWSERDNSIEHIQLRPHCGRN